MTKRAILALTVLCALLLPGVLGAVSAAQAAQPKTVTLKKNVKPGTGKAKSHNPAPFEKSTTLDLMIFWGLALGTAGFSLFMITRRSPMMSALCLLGVFLNLAGIYILLEAPFMAFIQLIVYAGAVIVLFVFVIMSVGSAREEEGLPDVATYVGGLVLAGVGSVMLLYAERFNWTGFFLLNGIALALFVWRVKPHPVSRFFGTGAAAFAVVQLIRLGSLDQVPMRVARTEFGSVAEVGKKIFRDNVFAFEALSLLLLAAIVAAVVLVRSVKQEETPDADEPAPGPEAGEKSS